MNKNTIDGSFDEKIILYLTGENGRLREKASDGVHTQRQNISNHARELKATPIYQAERTHIE